jgi:mono/diheme cytochrome c family protein
MNADSANTTLPIEPAAGQCKGAARWIMWAVLLACFLGYRGCLFVDQQGAGFDKNIHGPWQNAAQIAIAVPPKDEDPLFREGKNVYTASCAPCHQVTGLGAPGVAPPLVESEWVLAEGNARLIRIILNGVAGPITVKGQEWNLAMVPWRDSLNDKQVAAVITYIRQNKDWGHKASGAKPEEVAKIRQDTASKSGAFSAAELLAIPVK